MKKLLILIFICVGVFVLLRPVGDFKAEAVGNIVYRRNLVTGIITADNGDKSYAVEIGESGKSIKKVFTLSPDPDLKVGDKARIFYRGGNKEDMILLAPTKSLALILYENQLINDDNWMNAYGTNWIAYFFQAESDHNIREIQSYMTRTGSPGTVIVSLYPNESTGNFKPIIGGGALITGNTNGNTLPTSGGEWRTFPIASYSLTNGTWYSIVVKALDGNISNYAKWWGTNEDVLPNQWRHYSFNSGVDWYAGVFDLTFKIYGN